MSKGDFSSYKKMMDLSPGVKTGLLSLSWSLTGCRNGLMLKKISFGSLVNSFCLPLPCLLCSPGAAVCDVDEEER